MEKEVASRHDFKAIVGVFFLILIVLMFFLSLKSQSAIGNIIAGMLPTIVYLAVNFELLYHTRHKRFLVWVFPVVLVILFYAIAKMWNVRLIAQMDLGTLVFLNLLISYIFAAIILFYVYVQREVRHEHQLYVRELRKEIRREHDIHETPGHLHHENQHDRHHSQQSLKESIHSLEDKCKAINYAIGRVYSDKHGGSKEVRERIMISKDWYNKFSSLSEFSESDKATIRLAVDLIERRLALLDFPEKDVFPGNHGLLKKIVRDPKGNDTVASVLVRNDKDPVESYIKGARKACEELMLNL